jgi:hypothetical protein
MDVFHQQSVAALFAADGVLLGPACLRSADRLRSRRISKRREPYPVQHDEPVMFLHANGACTAEIVFTGALVSGATATFEAVAVFDFHDDGCIVRMTSWFDLHLVRRRLAAAHAQGHDSATAGGT